MRRRPLVFCVAVVIFAAVTAQRGARADESGISYWLPGSFASLAATSSVPGFAFATVYYHTQVSSGANVAAAISLSRARSRGTLTLNLAADVHASADIAIFVPTYTFATPVLDGQFSLSAFVPYGRAQTTLDATLAGSLGSIGFGAAASVTDSVNSFGDPSLQAALKWNYGVHNIIVYTRAGIPVGDYDSERLANLGKGHGALDGGFGYTYFDPKAGLEFSAVTGFTYNFENPTTDYQNGVDWHLDWAAAKFLSPSVFVGAVGYVYSQISADSGAGAQLGAYKSQVMAAGPQIGFIFPLGNMQGFLNLKGYREFAAINRSEGWNTWLTFSVSPAAKPAR